MILEWSIESVVEMKAARNLGIQRVELCSSLDLGGLTPSAGLMEACSNIDGPEIHPIIRPRAGDFVYSEEEIQIMLYDIQVARKFGAKGVVFGALDEHSYLDKSAVKLLVDLSKSLELEITFHRAFDFVKNPLEVLERLVELGIDRILTSGQQPKAEQGIDLIQQLVQQSKGRIQIMAGFGVNASNASLLIKAGVDALHCTARKKLEKPVDLGMGNQYQPDREKIEGILQVLSK